MEIERRMVLAWMQEKNWWPEYMEYVDDPNMWGGCRRKMYASTRKFLEEMDVSQLIMTAFLWSGSTEGHGVWERRHRELQAYISEISE